MLPGSIKPYAFDESTGLAIVRLAKQLRNRNPSQFGDVNFLDDQRGPTVHVYIAKAPSGGIAAMSGTTPGSATCTLYKFNSSNVLTVTSPAQTLTVFNTSMSAIVGDAFLKIQREILSGKFVADPIYFKLFIRFTLTAALATTDTSETATIADQWGPGMLSPNTGSGAITVFNHASQFEGASGASGLAVWDSGTSYRIYQMVCP